jgi:hypothetical protein
MGKFVIRNNAKLKGSISSGTGDEQLTLDSDGSITKIASIDPTSYLSSTLGTSQIYVGNSSSIATAVPVTGAVTISTTGVTTLASDLITNTHINSAAAIAYSKLNLTGSILNVDINASAAIARTKLASGTAYRFITNNSSGVLSETAVTASVLVATDANGLPASSGISTTTAAYIDATSSIQTQLNNRLSFSSAITPTAGDTIIYSGGVWTNLGIGTTGQVLTVSGGGLPSWASGAASGTLPTGGTANQYLRKIDATNYNTEWDTLALADLSDITASISQVNALATGYYDATSSVQTQLDAKLSSSLTTDNILVGVGGVATAGTNLPTGITVGLQYIYRTNGTDVTLADGGTGASLVDPGADRILFWDDSASQTTWLQVSTGLTLSGTTLTLTDPAWKLTGTSTLTGAATIASNTANQHIFNGTWTATANSQYHISISPTITGRGTASDSVFGISLAPSLTAGADSQSLISLYINPTASGGAFTGTVNYAIKVDSGIISTQGNVLIGSSFLSSFSDQRLVVKGTGTSSATGTLSLIDSANAKMLEVLDDGILRIGNASSRPNLTSSASSTTASKSGNTLLLASPSDSTAFIFNQSGTLGTGAWKTLEVRGTYASSSALAAAGIAVNLIPTINTTVSYLNSYTAIDYNPTLTSVTGLTHYGLLIRPTAALNGFGTATPTSTVDIVGSLGANTASTSTDLTLDVTHHTIRVDASGANRTITLPTAASSTRRIYIIKKIDATANTVTIDGSGAETIDAATTKVINTQYSGYVIQSNATSWDIIGTF